MSARNASPQATLVLAAREQFSTTPRALETLYERTGEPFELVCVDAGSPPFVRQYLEHEARARGFTLLRTEQFLTPNQARNVALPHVRTPYVAFVDNDVLVALGWLAPLVDCARQTGAWVVGPLAMEADQSDYIHSFGGTCRIDERDGGRDYVERLEFAGERLSHVTVEVVRQETELVELRTALVSMEGLRRVGRFDEELFTTSESGDLCLRVRALGGRVFVEPKSRITFAPPQQLAGADLEYFQLRWSEAWCEATSRRLREKWSLGAEAPGVALAVRLAVDHRRDGVTSLPTWRRTLGRRIAAWIETRFVAEREAEENRRLFPSDIYGRTQRPKIRVAYEPTAARAAA